MKKNVIITFAIFVVCIMILVGGILENSTEEFYPLTVKITSLDKENDIVYCVDGSGFLWSFFGCEDWEVNDIASLLMNSHGTDIIYDDEIVLAHYSANIF